MTFATWVKCEENEDSWKIVRAVSIRERRIEKKRERERRRRWGDANVPISIYPWNELWTEVIREDERIEVIRACAELRTSLNFP